MKDVCNLSQPTGHSWFFRSGSKRSTPRLPGSAAANVVNNRAGEKVISLKSALGLYKIDIFSA